jgi:hypothetical protein
VFENVGKISSRYFKADTGIAKDADQTRRKYRWDAKCYELLGSRDADVNDALRLFIHTVLPHVEKL